MTGRYLSEQHRAPQGHVVVQFVDDQLARRTLSVPFHRSDAESVQELVNYVSEHVPLRPDGLYDKGG